jgi:hypothetical protein
VCKAQACSPLIGPAVCSTFRTGEKEGCGWRGGGGGGGCKLEGRKEEGGGRTKEGGMGIGMRCETRRGGGEAARGRRRLDQSGFPGLCLRLRYSGLGLGNFVELSVAGHVDDSSIASACRPTRRMHIRSEYSRVRADCRCTLLTTAEMLL